MMMMNYKITSLLVVCALFFAVAQSGDPTLIRVSAVPTTYVGVWSGWIFINTRVQPVGSLTITLSVDAGTAELSATSLTFTNSTSTLSYRVKASTLDIVQVGYTLSGDLGEFVAPPTTSVYINQRYITVEDLVTDVLVNIPTEPLKIALSHPSSQSLTLTPSADNDKVVFVPNAVTIDAGSIGGSFAYYISDILTDVYITVTWAIAGQEKDWYANASSFDQFTSRKRQVSTTPFSPSILLHKNSTVLYAYITDRTNASSVVVIPQAADTVFTPDRFEFTPDQYIVPFTFSTSSPGPYPGPNAKSVFFSIEGGDLGSDYAAPGKTSVNVPLEVVTVVVPDFLLKNRKALISVRISAPVSADLGVNLYAANLVFNPNNITFTGGITSQVVEVLPIAEGSDTVSVLLTGSDVDYYGTPNPVPTTIGFGTFNTWATLPSLWVGVQSEPLYVRLNVVPDGTLTLTPSAPDFVFTPAVLTFDKNTIQQYFTITPQPTSTSSPTDVADKVNVDFILGGSDWASYEPPGLLPVTVLRRTVQIVWSPHLFDVTNTLQLHIGKSYVVWATANYVTDPFTVTPISQYATFNPSTLSFSAQTLRIKYTVTITAANAGSSITYVIGGVGGGYYDDIVADSITTSLRPISIFSAVISPDNRVPGTVVTSPSKEDLSTDHVYSFLLDSPVIPDSQLTITPRSLHITFNPASIQLSSSTLTTVLYYQELYDDNPFYVPNSHVRANFSVTPLSSGKHEVWFELGGGDAAYYKAPDHALLSFYIEERPPSETPVLSSSTHLMLSLSTFVLLLVVGVVF